MAVKIDDVERLRRLLSADQLRNAVVFERVFMPRGKTVVFADNESNAGAVAAVEMPEHEGDNYSMAMQGTTPDAARDVLRAVPDGGYWIHLADEDLFPVLTERMRMGWYDRAWLLVMDPNEMRSEVRHQTQKIDVKWAHRIAAVWAADWDAGGYVKSRLEKGPSSGVLVEGISSAGV